MKLFEAVLVASAMFLGKGVRGGDPRPRQECPRRAENGDFRPRVIPGDLMPSSELMDGVVRTRVGYAGGTTLTPPTMISETIPRLSGSNMTRQKLRTGNFSMSSGKATIPRRGHGPPSTGQ